MGTGIGRGENRAMEAAQQAISSPLLDNISINGSTGVLLNITGGGDLTLGEVTQISEIVHDAAGDDAEIIFGAVSEPAMQGEIRVTVIATGFDKALGQHTGSTDRPTHVHTGHEPRTHAAAGGAGHHPPPRVIQPPSSVPNVISIDDKRAGLRAVVGGGPPKAAVPNDPNRRFAKPPQKVAEPINEMDIPTFIRRQMD